MIDSVSFSSEDIYKFEEKLVSSKDWVMVGPKDDFFDFLYDMVDYSPVHNVCLRSKTDNVVGQGFTREYMMNKTEDLTDLFRKIAFEYLTTGNVFLECVWANDRTKGVKSVYFIPSKYMRVGKTDFVYEEPDYYYYSEDFSKKKSVIEFSKLDPKNYTDRQIYHIKSYSPGYNFYGLPSYMSVINDVRLNHEISIHHLSNIQNGATPSLFINFRNSQPGSEKEQMDIKRKLEELYTGSQAAGKIIVSFSEPDNGPEITTINPTSNDQYYSTIFESVQKQILSGHKINSPSLIGLPDPSGLASQAEQITTSFGVFLNTTIKPIQNELISNLYPIIKLMFPDEEPDLQIIQNNITAQ